MLLQKKFTATLTDMKFIGLRLCDHDSSIAYFDGENIHYLMAERTHGIKHFGYNELSLWFEDVKHWGIVPSDIDAICVTMDQGHYDSVHIEDPLLEQEIYIPEFRQAGFTCPIYRIDHHYAHVLSSWTEVKDCDSGVVIDALGDYGKSTSVFKDNELIFSTNRFSLGSLLCDVGMNGFGLSLRVPLDELDIPGKIMALKGYGVHEYAPKGDWDATALYNHWDISKHNGLTQESVDYFYEFHVETEEAFVNFFHSLNLPETFVYAGGVALNTVINSRLRQEFPGMVTIPHCNDGGLTLGCLEYLRRKYELPYFDRSGFPYWVDDESPIEMPTKETITTTAELLASGKIVGWYQGNGEIGPRALGNRSILMDPTVRNGKDIINSKVKHREYYRPFGASVLVDKVSDYFDWEVPSPYMLYVMDTKDPEKYASIAHVDGTCRAQTVDSADNKVYYDLIKTFGDLTGTYMVLNTSLNVGGKPICGTISEALRVLETTEMDVLVVGNTIYYR